MRFNQVANYSSYPTLAQNWNVHSNVMIPNAGTYYVWVRARRFSSVSTNGIWLRVNNSTPVVTTTLNTATTYGNWTRL